MSVQQRNDKTLAQVCLTVAQSGARLQHASGRPLRREDYELWRPEPEEQELTPEVAFAILKNIGTSNG